MKLDDIQSPALPTSRRPGASTQREDRRAWGGKGETRWFGFSRFCLRWLFIFGLTKGLFFLDFSSIFFRFTMAVGQKPIVCVLFWGWEGDPTWVLLTFKAQGTGVLMHRAPYVSLFQQCLSVISFFSKAGRHTLVTSVCFEMNLTKGLLPQGTSGAFVYFPPMSLLNHSLVA